VCVGFVVGGLFVGGGGGGGHGGERGVLEEATVDRVSLQVCVCVCV